MAKYKRRIKLIKPSLQLKLTFVFVGLSAMALLLQFVLLANSLSQLALLLPNDGMLLVDKMAPMLFGALATSFVVFLPIVFAVGVLTTFRIAGPLYRFEMFMNQVIRGEKPGDCRIRKGDQLQDFCVVLNEVTRPLREQAESNDDKLVDVDSVTSLVAEREESSSDAEYSESSDSKTA